MKVNRLSKDEFFKLIYYNTEEFLHKIVAPEVLVIKEFMESQLMW